MKKCDKCDVEFKNHGEYANHMRWNHKDDEYYANFSDKMSKIGTDYYLNKFGEYGEFNVNCEKCGKLFIVKERVNRFPEKEKYFCCRSCANSRNHSKETLNKISNGIKEKWKDGTLSTSYSDLYTF